jgi:YjbE family integral membrane protein
MNGVLELLAALGGIILVDLALSGDNALVIGAAAAALPQRQRRIALVVGGAGAMILRIALGAAATILLELPLLQAIGGGLLIIIAIRLLAGRHTEATLGEAPAKHSLLGALLTILVADVTMSLDNVLAVGALAAGNIPLLAGGLVLSMAIVLVGSALVAALIGRLPLLLDLAALVLGWTAASMVLHDLRLGPVLAAYPWTAYAVPAAGLGLVIIADLLLRARDRRSRRAAMTTAPEREREPARR